MRWPFWGHVTRCIYRFSVINTNLAQTAIFYSLENIYHTALSLIQNKENMYRLNFGIFQWQKLILKSLTLRYLPGWAVKTQGMERGPSPGSDKWNFRLDSTNNDKWLRPAVLLSTMWDCLWRFHRMAFPLSTVWIQAFQTTETSMSHFCKAQSPSQWEATLRTCPYLSLFSLFGINYSSWCFKSC